MKKSVKIILVSVLLLVGIISFQFMAGATDYPFDNLFVKGFEGYTTHEKQVKTTKCVSSQNIEVAAGETVWFGPCETTQYFHLVGFDQEGNAVTGQVRGKDLEVADTLNNNLVIYSYKVPEGVGQLCFTVKSSLADVYTIAKTEITSPNWKEYWDLKGVDVEDYIGTISYYEVTSGDKIYFGAITREDALATVAYSETSNLGTIDEDDLRLVDSFGGDFGIYCYTVASDVKYIEISYDTNYEQYYTMIQKDASDTTSDEAIIDQFITEFGIPKPVSATVDTLSGKSALFVGDSITYGARDRAKIYKYGSWAGRIGYFCDMDVLNNGVSGACITTARVESHSTKHYIYNNLVAAKDQTFDYVIMHGLFNDASIPVEVGTAQGAANFDPDSADVTKFADALELLFYTAKTQHPEATLGYIVNFHTERSVDEGPYVEAAIEICEDWGIPYLDLYNDTTFSVEFDDGLHPSSRGYDTMYTRVANWMATLNDENTNTDTVTSSARAMSYNVFWNTSTLDTGILNRISKIKDVITANDPDVLMLQEVSDGTDGWVPEIKSFAEENGYGYYGYFHKIDAGIDSVAGVDTSGSSTISEEMTPVLWKTSKYDCVDKGHFWASSTPEIAGSGWEGVESEAENGKEYPRCVSWVILQDKTTQEHLMVVSYHADPYTAKIRNLTAQLIVEKVSQISAEYDNLAIVIGGDWNMQRSQTAYFTVAGNGYGDAQKDAAVTTTQGSYNAWTRDTASFGVGDYLFMDKGTYVAEYSVYNDYDSLSSKYLSDHSPIIADIQY